MFCTCDNVVNMPKMIQIRNVPDRLHRKLKARAAEQGLTLSDYLLRMAEREADRPTIAELTERIRRRGPARTDISAAEIVREMRDASG
jgi:antitoxin FitA